MVVNIPDNGLLLESSAKAMVGLPTQAFAITLSDSMIEDMIKCVQDGGDLQLSLGNNPSILFDNQTIKIPNSPGPFEYDLFQSNTAAPTQLDKLPNPTMNIFGPPKPKSQAAKKTTKAAKAKAERPAARAKANIPTSKPGGDLEVECSDDAVAYLKTSMAKVEAGKAKPGKSRLLGAPVPTVPRSLSASPALSGLGSPSLGPSSASQEKVKQQRFPIIHELAVQELTFDDLFSKYNDGSEQDFQAALKKVADFDDGLQKYVLKKMYWKELDVFQYEYAEETDRQKAIENAIKQYDRMRLGKSDPLWQKLLPVEERDKGKCLSKLQAAIAMAQPAPAPKIGGGSPSGGDSERDDSASSGTKKGKGGEPMSRSSSQTSTKKKLSASEAQAKRLLTNSKKPAATATTAAAKASPKVSPTKPTVKAPAAKAPVAAKGGRVLSKEFVTDSDSENDEVPLSLQKSKPTVPKAAPAEKPKPIEKPKPAEKTKPTERTKLVDKPKAKVPVAAKPNLREGEQDKDKERDTIRAQVVAKPAKLPAKRARDAEDDDSSSSGTPLSKRIKPAAKAPVAAVNSLKKRAPSEASQNSRGTSSGVSLNKSKNTSPVKSSPLASSPPTNASDMEDDRHMMPRGREREHDRDTVISDSSSSGSSVGHGRKRPADLSSDSRMGKRQRVSPEVMLKAHKFKQFYVRYHELHEEISRHENPHPDKVADLMDMRDRLSEMKREIYSEVTAE
ncbi:hypothetical protein V8F33_000421 [Rhypophila sp. PSN 637]